MYVTAYNTTSAPVTVDAEGRTVSARDWGTANTTSEQAKAALEDGRLVITEVANDGHPDAVAARDRTAVIAARATELSGLDKDVLADTAADAGVPGADDLAKPELVHALAVRTDIDVPTEKREPASAEQPPEEHKAVEGEAASPESGPGEEASPEQPPRKATSGRRAGRGTE